MLVVILDYAINRLVLPRYRTMQRNSKSRTEG